MLRHVNEEEQNAEGERPVSPSFYDEQSKRIPWYHMILLNKPLKVAIVMMLASFLAPLLVFFFLYEGVYVKVIYNDGYSSGICSHSSDHRVPCGISAITEPGKCAKDCCYDENNKFCYHRVPSKYSYISKTSWVESKNLTPRIKNIPYGIKPNIQAIRLHFDEISDKHLNFMIYDPNFIKLSDVGRIVSNKNFFYKIFYPEIFVEIFSKEINISKPFLSTARGPLIAADNLWEWSLYISDDALYGLGNFFLKPQLMYSTEDNPHASPFFMSQRNGSYHGVYLEQDGPLNINMTESKVVTVQSLAGHKIGVHFFYGPSPSEVVNQYMNFVGKQDIPPYWALGVHFCRGNVISSQNVSKLLEEFYNFTEAAETNGIPYDSDCIADGVFDFLNFDLTQEDLASVTNAVETLKNASRKFLPTLRPHIRANDGPIYDSADKLKILFLEPKNNRTYVTSLYNISVAVPDYSLEVTVSWMKSIWPFYSMTDSFVLSDNWPKVDNGTSNCFVTNIPFITKKINTSLCESIPWNARDPVKYEKHMDSHNSYGSNHARAVRNVVQATNQTDNFILSSSTFPGTSSGAHTQNVTLSWSAFSAVYRDAVWKSMQGLHIQSVPVCGDAEDSAEEDIEHLCIKWYLASVFLPVFRVTSNNIDKHPLAFTGYASKIMANAIKMRYKLLPYFYSTLLSGQPLIRPMFYSFPEGNTTTNIDEQFTVGEAIIIAPNFKPRQTSVSVFLPRNETVYDLWGGNQYFGPDRPSPNVDITSLENEIVALLRAGYILPIQEKVYKTASETRVMSNFTLVVGLNCTKMENYGNSSCVAGGYLIISNTSIWSFNATEAGLSLDPSIAMSRPTLCRKSADGNSNQISSSIVDRIRVYGMDKKINNMGEYYLMDGLGLDVCNLRDGEIFTVNFT